MHPERSALFPAMAPDQARLGAGVHALNPAFLLDGAAAHDANDYIVYNRATGRLFYDANGNGAGGMVALAVLSNRPVLTAAISW